MVGSTEAFFHACSALSFASLPKRALFAVGTWLLASALGADAVEVEGATDDSGVFEFNSSGDGLLIGLLIK